MSSDCKHGKRTAAVFPEPEEELEIERWPDESECMWLTTNGKSSSFIFDNDGSWDLFSIDLQDLFSTMKNHDLFRVKRIFAFISDQSMAYPIKGASLVLDKTLKDVLNEEHLLDWFLNLKESSLACCESIRLSLVNPLNDNLSVLHSSDDLPNVNDQNKEFDALQCDLPNIIPNTVIEDFTSLSVPEFANLDEFDTNGPLFWPFEQKFGSASSESSWDFFVISPLKSGRKAVNVEGFITPNKPLMLRLNESRKHEEWTTKDLKSLRRTNNMPSRLRQSSQHSVKKKHIEFKDEVLLEGPKLLVEPSFIGKLASECKEFLEEDCLISEDIPIETLIGLEEFDGHEGVEADLIEDCFSFDEFLENNTNILSR
ncbi:hypothetical protein Sjap_009426 [Stephania japonica]|uniref:Uncharacterized protein n=1 Tax=Stephania japonica TaxID=461633 RepID=A0AAP0PC94_9MAGN